MDRDAPVGLSPSVPSTGEPLRRLVSSLLLFLELRLRLFGLESKDAGIHLFILALLLVSALVFLTGFLALLNVFILYLLTLIFHWEWGWSALACAGVSLVLTVIAGVLFRFQIVKPFFPNTLAELRKDREWLKTTQTSEQ